MPYAVPRPDFSANANPCPAGPDTFDIDLPALFDGGLLLRALDQRSRGQVVAATAYGVTDGIA